MSAMPISAPSSRMRRASGRTFIIDQRVQGKVSVVTDRPLSRSEYFEIFLSTLRANGLVAVPAPGGSYRIQPADSAAGQPSAVGRAANRNQFVRSEEHTSELQSLMRISYAVFCLKKKKTNRTIPHR